MTLRLVASARVVVVVALTASSAVVAACGGTSEIATPVATTTTLHPSDRPLRLPSTTAGEDTTEPTADSPDLPPPALDVGDYEGQLYDFGQITDVRGSGGAVHLEFNRQQLYADDGTLVSGSDFNEEPIVYGNTDVPYVDDSPQIRRFVLSPMVRVIRIADPIPCASDENPTDPVWQEITVDDLVQGAWIDRLEDTLSFGQDGLVSQVRLSTAC